MSACCPTPAYHRAAAELGSRSKFLGNERIVLREISMFMGENYLITVH